MTGAFARVSTPPEHDRQRLRRTRGPTPCSARWRRDPTRSGHVLRPSHPPSRDPLADGHNPPDTRNCRLTDGARCERTPAPGATREGDAGGAHGRPASCGPSLLRPKRRNRTWIEHNAARSGVPGPCRRRRSADRVLLAVRDTSRMRGGVRYFDVGTTLNPRPMSRVERPGPPSRRSGRDVSGRRERARPGRHRRTPAGARALTPPSEWIRVRAGRSGPGGRPAAHAPRGQRAGRAISSE